MALQPIVPVPSFLVNPIVNSLPSSYPPLNTYNQQPHNPYQSFMYPQLSNVMQANPTPNLIAPTQSGFNYPTYPQPQQMLSQPYLSPFPFPHVESLPSIQPRPTIQPRPSVQLPIQPQPIRHSLQYPFNPEPSQNYFSGNTVNNTPAHVTPSPSPIISSASTNKNAHHTLTPVKKEPTTPSNSMEIVSFTPTKVCFLSLFISFIKYLIFPLKFYEFLHTILTDFRNRMKGL